MECCVEIQQQLTVRVLSVVVPSVFRQSVCLTTVQTDQKGVREGGREREIYIERERERERERGVLFLTYM